MKERLTWDDTLGWMVSHPYISSAVVVIMLLGALGKLTEVFPRFMRVIWIVLGIIVGGLVLFFWIIPSIEERLSTLSGQANAIIVGLVMIICLLVSILATLNQILKALERDR